MIRTPLVVVAMFATGTAGAAEVWPKLVERGFAQDFRTAKLGDTRVFENTEFWVEPDEGEAIACKQTHDEKGGRVTVTFVARGRCSVKFTKGLTGYEVNYTVARDPKEFVVPESVTVKVGDSAHLPCVSAIVAKQSPVLQLRPDLEEDGFTYVDGKKPGSTSFRCNGRQDQRKDVAVTVVP